MLDHSSHTSNLEELPFKFYGRSFRVDNVGEPNPVYVTGRSMSSVSFMWAISSHIAGVYIIVQNLNIPLILQPHILAFLFTVSWAQVMGLHYQGNFPAADAAYSVCFMAASGR